MHAAPGGEAAGGADVLVELVDFMGSDLRVVNAARISLDRNSSYQSVAYDTIEDDRLRSYLLDETDLDEAAANRRQRLREVVSAELGQLSGRDRGLIRFMMREKHASPFEHCVMTVRVETSIAVSREVFRHRTFSYNEFSTRYSNASEMGFYVPDAAHVRTQVGKPGAYFFEPIEDAATVEGARERMDDAYKAAMRAYDDLVASGVAREVARNVLPLGMDTEFFMTGNLRNWLNFLVLRNSEQALREIRDVAIEVERFVAKLFPVCYDEWVAWGRQQI